MTETTTNLTSPDQAPVAGDLITRTGANYSITEEYFGSREPQDPTDLEIAQGAREWRDAELRNTDYIVQIPDHPQKSAYTTYRVALRDWPSTSDFPGTKPTLGE